MRLSIAVSMPPMLRQCATTAITAVYAASTRLTMAAMLGRLVAQLKMPRLDAYPEQALAVFECLQVVREALCRNSGSQVQQAWRDQLKPDGPMPNFDPDVPFSSARDAEKRQHRRRPNQQRPHPGGALRASKPSSAADARARLQTLPRRQIEAELYRR